MCEPGALSALLGRDMDASALKVRSGCLRKDTAPFMSRQPGKRAYDYEAEVLTFLHDHREELGIAKVWRSQDVLVDGLLELQDSRILALEIKLAMNWLKACQAEWQFRTFLARQSELGPFDGGLVVFEDFSADWRNKAKYRPLQDGWYRWYQGHHEVEGRRLDLVRFREDKLCWEPAH